jgi:hypothetical protein
MQTIRRDWLMRQIDAGMVDAKCDYHLTDDYAYDNANKGGQTDWLPARVSRPYRKDPSSENHRFLDDEERDFISGVMNFRESDFEGSCGLCYWRDEAQTLIILIVHQNLSYSLRLRTTPLDAALRSKPLRDRSNEKVSTMTLERTRKRVKSGKYGFTTMVDGTTMILYGTNQVTDKWFSRNFPDADKARAYAAKQGWVIKGEEAVEVAAPVPSKPRVRVMATARQIA